MKETIWQYDQQKMSSYFNRLRSRESYAQSYMGRTFKRPSPGTHLQPDPITSQSRELVAVEQVVKHKSLVVFHIQTTIKGPLVFYMSISQAQKYLFFPTPYTVSLKIPKEDGIPSGRACSFKKKEVCH